MSKNMKVILAVGSTAILLAGIGGVVYFKMQGSTEEFQDPMAAGDQPFGLPAAPGSEGVPGVGSDTSGLGMMPTGGQDTGGFGVAPGLGMPGVSDMGAVSAAQPSGQNTFGTGGGFNPTPVYTPPPAPLVSPSPTSGGSQDYIDIVDPLAAGRREEARLAAELREERLRVQLAQAQAEYARLRREIEALRRPEPGETGPASGSLSEAEVARARAARDQAVQNQPQVIGIAQQTNGEYVAYIQQSDGSITQWRRGRTYGNYRVQEITRTSVRVEIMSDGQAVDTLDLPIGQRQGAGGNPGFTGVSR